MDISALQKLIASDLVANRTPLFLIADTGSSMCGYVDNIMRLQDVCRANSIWLHCRGHSLAAIAVTQGSGEVNIDFDAEIFVVDFFFVSISFFLRFNIQR